MVKHNLFFEEIANINNAKWYDMYSDYGYIKNHRFKNYKYRDGKKANKQDIRYYSIDSNRQDNIQLPL